MYSHITRIRTSPTCVRVFEIRKKSISLVKSSTGAYIRMTDQDFNPDNPELQLNNIPFVRIFKCGLVCGVFIEKMLELCR